MKKELIHFWNLLSRLALIIAAVLVEILFIIEDKLARNIQKALTNNNNTSTFTVCAYTLSPSFASNSINKLFKQVIKAYLKI